MIENLRDTFHSARASQVDHEGVSLPPHLGSGAYNPTDDAKPSTVLLSFNPDIWRDTSDRIRISHFCHANILIQDVAVDTDMHWNRHTLKNICRRAKRIRVRGEQCFLYINTLISCGK